MAKQSCSVRNSQLQRVQTIYKFVRVSSFRVHILSALDDWWSNLEHKGRETNENKVVCEYSSLLHAQVQTCPEWMWVVRVRKEVISFHCPTQVGFIDSLEVARRGGVHQLNPRLLYSAEMVIIDNLHAYYYLCCNLSGRGHITDYINHIVNTICVVMKVGMIIVGVVNLLSSWCTSSVCPSSWTIHESSRAGSHCPSWTWCGPCGSCPLEGGWLWWTHPLSRQRCSQIDACRPAGRERSKVTRRGQRWDRKVRTEHHMIKHHSSCD